MNQGIGFRCYRRTDLPACASICMKAFPLITSRFDRGEGTKVAEGQIDGSRAISSYHELAIADGEAVGLLFGRVKRKSAPIDMCQTLMRLFSLSVRFLLGKYGSRRKLIRLLRPGLQELRELRRNMPASEAEVVLFAVAPEYQGIGIGRALMDRFVRHALKHKVKAISVATEETASFWFYDKYGFERWAEYESALESYLADKPIKGFTYQLLVHEHKADG